RANDSGRVRLFSDNFPADGVIDFKPGEILPPRSVTESWGRFPFGVDFVLRRAGIPTPRGFDAVVHGNIPGGGMSRSASLAINLILTFLEVNGVPVNDGMQIVDFAQAV